jgi:hypothetical protein
MIERSLDSLRSLEMTGKGEVARDDGGVKVISRRRLVSVISTGTKWNGEISVFIGSCLIFRCVLVNAEISRLAALTRDDG